MKDKIRIIDNFLNTQDFEELNSINLDSIPGDKISVYHNEIDKNNKIKTSCLDKSLILNLHKNYHSKTIKILEDLNYEKSKLYDYSDFTIIKTGKNYKFPIHDDTPNKLLSGVIYLYPKDNTGTIFYSNKNGDSKKIVEWKQNRAVFFSRVEKETWHSYEGDGYSDRIALVYNLMTYDVKSVYSIEKKNYFFGNLRWKANPYLYRFLKINI